MKKNRLVGWIRLVGFILLIFATAVLSTVIFITKETNIYKETQKNKTVAFNSFKEIATNTSFEVITTTSEEITITTLEEDVTTTLGEDVTTTPEGEVTTTLEEKVTTTSEKATTTTNSSSHKKAAYVVEKIEESKGKVLINETVDAWTDEQLLAHLISAEAGNCSEQEMLWVGQVVLNRVASSYFAGDNIREIIFAPKQYAPTWNGALYKEPTPGAIKAAKLLLSGNRYIPENVLFQSNDGLKYKVYAKTESGIVFYTYK